MPAPGNSDDGKIFIEFLVQGSVVKVTAIHPLSGTEASIMGPSGAPRATLSDAAVRKLRYVLQKKNGGG